MYLKIIMGLSLLEQNSMAGKRQLSARDWNIIIVRLERFFQYLHFDIPSNTLSRYITTTRRITPAYTRIVLKI